MNREARQRITLAGVILLFAAVLLRNAWICDDAYITLRVVDNFTAGHGLVWNLGERVQPYTHPLWMFLVSLPYAVTREAYYTTIILSLLVSLSALVLFALRVPARPAGALVGLGLLSVSKAFVDYTSSGLENPLSYLCITAVMAIYLRRPPTQKRLTALAAGAALCAVTRMDTVLLVAPMIVAYAWPLPRAVAVRSIAIGLLPLWLWEAFSVLYYGFPFPNTAYAKLNTGIFRGELVRQGFFYVVHSLRADTVTIAIIAAGAIAPVALRQWRLIPISAGVTLYVAYVVTIGGDFMGGRMFAVPLLCAVAVIAQAPFKGLRSRVAAATLIVAAGFFAPHTPWLSGAHYGDRPPPEMIDANGVADERGYYFQDYGLFRADGGRGLAESRDAVNGRAAGARGYATASGNIGVFGYYAGPGAYILDIFALSDALLARLPLITTRWRVGHYIRHTPDGYPQTVQDKVNHITDPALARFYDRLSLIIHGPLFRDGRWGEIFRFNFGIGDDPTEPFYESFAHHQRAFEHARDERWDAAVAELRMAVELDSTRAEAWYGLSRIYQRRGELDASRDTLLRALRLWPGAYEEQLLELAKSFDAAGRTAEAEALVERMFGAFVENAARYEDRGYYAMARKEYEKALALDPENAEIQQRVRALRGR